jgi:SAM-dependent methyltransferase
MTGDMSVVDQVGFYARSTLFTLRRGQQNRDTTAVLDEYTGGWDQYRKFLSSTKNLDEWLWIPEFEDRPAYCNVNGKLSFQAFDSADYYRRTLLDCIRRHFPKARSVTEFGCGVGRNLLFLKRECPDIECFGYELCQPGVEVAQAAAQKFGIQVSYAQLDYVKDAAEKYVFPETDIAFTMFSLEQLPRNSDEAVNNILGHVRLGSIHMEPVPENYPRSLRGVLGRIEHRRVDYLSGFDAAVRSMNLRSVTHEKMASAHNPLMFPSLYILQKG